MANEILTSGIKVSYATTASGEFTRIMNVENFPDLGGSKDKVEVTNLGDTCHRYIDGIDNYGDTLTFSVFYDKAEFNALKALTGIVYWKIELPDDASSGTTCTFSGSCNVVIAGASGNEALKYNLNITPNSAMVFA